MKKTIVLLASMVLIGCNWSDTGCPDCVCDAGCCDSGSCSTADCTCSCVKK